MSAMGWFRYTWLAYGAKPTADRQIFRVIGKRKVTSVLEIGIGSLERAKHLIAACKRFSADAPLRYAAVDWFEERPANEPELSLIAAHRELGAAGAKVRVSPGGPAAVEAVANLLPNLDLVLISPHVSDEQLGRGWYFIPRMCHAQTVVLRAHEEANGLYRYETLSREAIDQKARLGRGPIAA